MRRVGLNASGGEGPRALPAGGAEKGDFEMSGIAYHDLRGFLSEVEALGELKTIHGVHWDKEMGAITEILYREKAEKSPALLFDRITGYPEGYRCLYGMLNSP